MNQKDTELVGDTDLFPVLDTHSSDPGIPNSKEISSTSHIILCQTLHLLSPAQGWDGSDDPGKEEPGLKDLIDRLLGPWKEDIVTEGGSPKPSMIFCKVRRTGVMTNYFMFIIDD